MPEAAAPSPAEVARRRSERAVRVLNLEKSTKGFWADLKRWLVALDAKSAASKHAEMKRRHDEFLKGLSLDELDDLAGLLLRETKGV
jgi:hypothetical protein